MVRPPASRHAVRRDPQDSPIIRAAIACGAIYLMSGQGSYEDPKRSQQLSEILESKGIPHTLDLWGADVNHDWPWWRKMLPHVLGKIVQG